MVAALQTTAPEPATLAHLLEPDILVDGQKPERRAVYSGISWTRYMEIDKKRGDDCSVPKFYYLDGDLEIMSSSDEHERIKKMIGDFLAIFFAEREIDVVPRGQATMWLELKEAGAEPDESWCIGTVKKYPDIAVEIALTSGGINKLELYQRFQVPEVWIWRKGKLEFYVLGRTGSYKHAARSQFVPDLDPQLLEQCVNIPSWLEACRTFRTALKKSARSHGG